MAVVVVFAAIGVTLLSISNAATYVVAIEAESGNLSGLQSKQGDASASGSQAVAFGNGTVSPPPVGGGGSFNGPFKISADRHYFVDQDNKPFLYVADTIWTLFTLSEANAKSFIDIRASQGYNVIQAALPGFEKAGFNNNNMAQPNTAYMEKADRILAYAASKNIAIYMGSLWGGKDLSSQEATTYGTWLGTYFKAHKNILWFVGGDSKADSAFTTNKNIGQALKAANPTSLISYHLGGLITPWFLKNEPWYDYYSYQWNGLDSPLTYQASRDGYKQTPTKPFLTVEPAYEPTNADPTGRKNTSVLDVRQGNWWAVLGGAAGVAYGGPASIWDATGYPSGDVARPAAVQTGYVSKILNQVAWYKLIPDFDHQAVTAGYGAYGQTSYVTAGLANDGSLLVAYMPSNRAITVSLSKLSGPATAQWYDPSNGQTSGAGSSVANNGSQQFTPPGNNAAGNSDWVLVIKR